jgi:hypothetical protein
MNIFHFIYMCTQIFIDILHGTLGILYYFNRDNPHPIGLILGQVKFIYIGSHIGISWTFKEDRYHWFICICKESRTNLEFWKVNGFQPSYRLPKQLLYIFHIWRFFKISIHYWGEILKIISWYYISSGLMNKPQQANCRFWYNWKTLWWVRVGLSYLFHLDAWIFSAWSFEMSIIENKHIEDIIWFWI